MSPTVQDDAAVQWLAQADLLLWLAQWLRPPSAEAPPVLDDEQGAELLSAAGLERSDELIEALRALEAARQTTSSQLWSHEYHRLFEAGVLCPTNEASYVRRDKGAILGDICGFYQAFGVRHTSDSGDRPDHVVCELQFAALLLAMSARAARQSEEPARQVTRQALEAFAADHLDAWTPLFCEHLAAVTVLPLYERFAALLHAAWEALVEAQGLPRAAGAVTGLPMDEPESPYACGMADAEAPVDLHVKGRPQPPAAGPPGPPGPSAPG